VFVEVHHWRRAAASVKREAGTAVSTRRLLSTARDDAALPPVACASLPSREVRNMTQVLEQTGEAWELVVGLRYAAVAVRTVDDVIKAVENASKGGAGRVGLPTKALAGPDDRHQTAAQAALDKGHIFAVMNYIAPTAGRRGMRSGLERRAAAGQTSAVGAGDVAASADVTGAEEGALDVDFASWHDQCPLHIRHRRDVDGVVLEEDGLPSVMRVHDAVISVSIRRRDLGAAAGPTAATRRWQGHLRVTLTVETEQGKPIELSPNQVVLAQGAGACCTVALRAVNRGKCSIGVRVVDIGPDPARPVDRGSISHHRPVTVGERMQLPWDGKRGAVLFHKGTPDLSVLADMGVDTASLGPWVPSHAGRSPQELATHTLSAPPVLAAAVMRQRVTGEETGASAARILEDAGAELRGGVQDDQADVESMDDDSDDDKDGKRKAPADSEKARKYNDYVSNRHMLSFGVDLRKPYVPVPDTRTTRFTPIGGGSGRRGKRLRG